MATDPTTTFKSANGDEHTVDLSQAEASLSNYQTAESQDEATMVKDSNHPDSAAYKNASAGYNDAVFDAKQATGAINKLNTEIANDQKAAAAASPVVVDGGAAPFPVSDIPGATTTASSASSGTQTVMDGGMAPPATNPTTTSGTSSAASPVVVDGGAAPFPVSDIPGATTTASSASSGTQTVMDGGMAPPATNPTTTSGTSSASLPTTKSTGAIDGADPGNAGSTSIAGIGNAKSGSGGGTTIKVHSGDTMSSIAATHGVSLAALEAANSNITNPNLIFPNETINLPTGSSDTLTTSGGSGAATETTVTPQAPEVNKPNHVTTGGAADTSPGKSPEEKIANTLLEPFSGKLKFNNPFKKS